MHDMNASVLRANETTNMRVDTVERRVKSWQENMADEMGALKEVPKMCKQLTIINERNDDFQSKMFSINDALASLKFQQRTMKETLEPKVDDLFSTLNRLDNAVMEDRGNNLILITKTCDQMFDRLKLELGKLQTKFFSYVNTSENMAVEHKCAVDRVDRMYNRIKEDVNRHETLCYEIATKFTQQHDVLVQIAENTLALKTYTLINELHMEAYLPLQSATIAFEVCKGVFPR